MQRECAGMCCDKGCWNPALISAVPELTGLLQEEH